MTRLNNLGARLIVNDWLVRSGHTPFPSDISYEEYATRLRAMRARTLVQVNFASRADAVAYIRETARAVRNC